jgi:hypothetical protein
MIVFFIKIFFSLEQQHLYKTLYSSRNINDYDESFFNHDIKLTEDQKDLCEGNLTLKECAESLKFMINGKSPGSDGYTVDFISSFGKILVHLFFGLFSMDTILVNFQNSNIKVLLPAFLRKEKTDNILVIGDLLVF